MGLDKIELRNNLAEVTVSVVWIGRKVCIVGNYLIMIIRLLWLPRKVFWCSSNNNIKKEIADIFPRHKSCFIFLSYLFPPSLLPSLLLSLPLSLIPSSFPCFPSFFLVLCFCLPLSFIPSFSVLLFFLII